MMQDTSTIVGDADRRAAIVFEARADRCRRKGNYTDAAHWDNKAAEYWKKVNAR